MSNATPEMAEARDGVRRHMISDEVQRRIVEKLRMLPARQSIQNDPLFDTDPTLQASLAQLKNGRLMPTATELRAVWDAMRPPYQALLERRDDARRRPPRHAARRGAKHRRDAPRHHARQLGRRVQVIGGCAARRLDLSGSGAASCGSCAIGGAIGSRTCSRCRRSS